MADLRIFVECSTKAVFDAQLEAGNITSRHLVLIKSTNQIYHNGVYYGLSAEDASKLAAVYARKEFGYVSDGTNTYRSSAAEGTLTITESSESGEVLDVTVGASGVTIKLVAATGTTNGTISLNGTEVAVAGLGSAAFTESSAYATAAQGALADNAVPQTRTVNGHALSADVTVTKGDVGLGNVDNESKATMFTSPEFTGTPIAPTAALGTNTTQIATTAFVKAEIDDVLAAADALVFKGTVDTTEGLPANHTLGWTYIVAEAGTYAGQVCEVGDMIICKATGTAASNADWTVVQTNINGAVTGPASAVDGNVAIFNGTTGKIIADSGLTLGQSVPSTGVFDDHKYTFAAGTDGSFTVTENVDGEHASTGTPQTISIGKPATAGTADQVGHDLSITLGASGTAQTFDGAADLSITVTPSAIGAAEEVHTHTADEVIKMGTATNPYAKPASVAAAISTDDSLQTAIGKLEAMFDWVVYNAEPEP